MSPKVNPVRSLIVCATRRSGSTMVYDDLRALLGVKKKYGEILDRLLFNTEPKLKFSEAWPQACAENNVQSIVTQKINSQQVVSISRAIESDEVQSIDEAYFEPEACDAFFSFFRDAQWVHVHRKDIFAQAISHHMARHTGIWHARIFLEPSLIPVYNQDVAYDLQALLAILEEAHRQRQRWPALFARHGVEPFEIVYEHAVANYPGYWEPFFSSAGLKAVQPTPARREIQLANDVSAAFRQRLEDDARELSRGDGKDAPWLRDLLATLS